MLIPFAAIYIYTFLTWKLEFVSLLYTPFQNCMHISKIKIFLTKKKKKKLKEETHTHTISHVGRICAHGCETFLSQNPHL